MSPSQSDLTKDINILSTFLAHNQLTSLASLPEKAALILVGSAILHTAETVFQVLSSNTPGPITDTLVICGGIGHSTSLLYSAIAAHPIYHTLPSLLSTTHDGSLEGMPEARVLYELGRHFFDLDRLQEERGLRVLIEEQSANCGANAGETRRVLDAAGLDPRSLVVVQDPTMALRTVASFRKAYSDRPEVGFISWPTFVPRVEDVDGVLDPRVNDDEAKGRFRFAVADQGVDARYLWSAERFLELLLGEIPRLRDDENGYGPMGKGFIAHVEVEQDVEEAWGRLKEVVGEGTRR